MAWKKKALYSWTGLLYSGLVCFFLPVHCQTGGREAGLSHGSILSHPGDQGRGDGWGLYWRSICILLIRTVYICKIWTFVIFLFSLGNYFPDYDNRRNHHGQEEQKDLKSLIITCYLNKALIYHNSVSLLWFGTLHHSQKHF